MATSNIERAATGGTADHGGLTGLTDDDHAQYVLIAGTRTLSASDTSAFIIDGDTTPYTGSSDFEGISANRTIANIGSELDVVGLSNIITNGNVLTGTIPDSTWSSFAAKNYLTVNGSHTVDLQDGSEKNYGLQNKLTRSGTLTGLTFTMSNYGNDSVLADTTSFNNASGTYTLFNYGHKIQVSSNGSLTAGTLTKSSYGSHITVTSNAVGTATNYGLYLDTISGADTNWGVYDNAGKDHYLKGKVGLNTTTIGAQLALIPASAATIAQIITLASAQTADALQIKNNAGTTLLSVNKDGDLLTTRGEFTTSLRLQGLADGLARVSNGFFIDGSQVELTSEVSGTLPVTNGGTGLANIATDNLVTGNGTSALTAESSLTFDGTTLNVATGRITVDTDSTSAVGLTVKAITSQSANLVEIKDSANTFLSGFQSDGTFKVGSTIPGIAIGGKLKINESGSIVNHIATHNNTTTGFAGWTISNGATWNGQFGRVLLFGASHAANYYMPSDSAPNTGMMVIHNQGGTGGLALGDPGDNPVRMFQNNEERVELNATETVWNDSGYDIDFRVEGDSLTHLFFVDAGNERIGINNSAPADYLHVIGVKSSTSTPGAAGIIVADNTTAGIGRGGGIVFYGPYTGTTNTTAAAIHAYKQNGTGGNYSFDLAFNCRVNGGTNNEVFRATADGRFAIGVTTATSTLHVEKSVASEYLTSIKQLSSSGGGLYVELPSDGGQVALFVSAGSGASPIFRITDDPTCYLNSNMSIGGTHTSLAALDVRPESTGTKACILRQASAATANFFECQNNSGTALSSIDKDGGFSCQAFQMDVGATVDYVLKCDANGNGTWQAEVGGAGAGATEGFATLPVQQAKLPTSNPARIDASDQNWRLLYDDTTDQSAIWQLIVPINYGTDPSIKLIFAMNSTQTGSLNVVWTVELAAITPSSDASDIASKSFATANSSTHALATNQTAGYPRAQSITLTNDDSAAVGDILLIRVTRDANHASDTATGDAELLGIELQWTY